MRQKTKGHANKIKDMEGLRSQQAAWANGYLNESSMEIIVIQPNHNHQLRGRYMNGRK